MVLEYSVRRSFKGRYNIYNTENYAKLHTVIIVHLDYKLYEVI